MKKYIAALTATALFNYGCITMALAQMYQNAKKQELKLPEGKNPYIGAYSKNLPMPDISHLEQVFEEDVNCTFAGNTITIRKYADPGTQMILAMDVSRKDAKRPYIIKILGADYYYDDGSNGRIAEDGLIDIIRDNKTKAKYPACESRPEVYSL